MDGLLSEPGAERRLHGSPARYGVRVTDPIAAAVHTLVYTDDPAATRAFFRDVMGFGFVADGDDEPTEHSWLIFGTGPSELGVHPTSGSSDSHDSEAQDWSTRPHHQISFVVADIEQAARDITARGGEVRGEPVDMGFGIGVQVAVPGADDVLVYQARHSTAYDAG